MLADKRPATQPKEGEEELFNNSKTQELKNLKT